MLGLFVAIWEPVLLRKVGALIVRLGLWGLL